jgi:hypothetical protein
VQEREERERERESESERESQENKTYLKRFSELRDEFWNDLPF